MGIGQGVLPNSSYSAQVSIFVLYMDYDHLHKLSLRTKLYKTTSIEIYISNCFLFTAIRYVLIVLICYFRLAQTYYLLSIDLKHKFFLEETFQV